MRRGKRPGAVRIGQREARAISANLGRDTRATRRRRHLTQARLGELVGLSQSEISRLELGQGAGASIETWVAIGIALNRPIGIGYTRDTVEPLTDAGHLDAQELVARLVRAAGWRVTFEAPNDPRAPTGSTDLRLDRHDGVVLVEIWNRVDDLVAATRSGDRKLASVPGARTVWLLVDTAANRAIVRRYPTLLNSRFPGSSSAWVAALTSEGPVPARAGLAWVDVRSGRLRPFRNAASSPTSTVR